MPMQQQQQQQQRPAQPKSDICTAPESLNLMKNLLSSGFSCVTYLRNLFAEDNYSDSPQNGLMLKALKRGVSEEADRILDWLELGCFDALERRYLRKIVFCVYLDAENPLQLQETYDFKIAYPASSSSSSESDDLFLTIAKDNVDIARFSSKKEIKKATQQLMRTLVTLTQTLRPLPDHRLITVKLFYYDAVTPPDYQPPLFRAGVDENWNFPDKSVKIRVGQVQTPHHSMDMKIETTPGNFEDTDEVPEVADADDAISSPVTDVSDAKAAVPPPLPSSDEKRAKEEPHSPSPVSHVPAMPHLLPSSAQAVERKSDYKRDRQHMKKEKEEEDAVVNSSGSSPSRTNSLSGLSQEDFKVFSCPCEVNEHDHSYMPPLQCRNCQKWQHASCCGYRFAAAVRKARHHVCPACLYRDSISKEFVVAIRKLAQFRSVAALVYHEDRTYPSTELAKKTCLSLNAAREMNQLLEKFGFVRCIDPAGTQHKRFDERHTVVPLVLTRDRVDELFSGNFRIAFTRFTSMALSHMAAPEPSKPSSDISSDVRKMTLYPSSSSSSAKKDPAASHSRSHQKKEAAPSEVLGSAASRKRGRSSGVKPSEACAALPAYVQQHFAISESQDSNLSDPTAAASEAKRARKVSTVDSMALDHESDVRAY